MDERVYWIWLQHAFGEGSPMPWRISQTCPGGVEGFYQGGPRLWNSLDVIREKDASALYGFTLQEAQAQLEYAEKVGWRVLTPECEKYPLALRNIFDPPAVLYCKGKLPDVDNQPAIAVVGARKAQKVSENKGKEFSYQLAIGGAVVITGGAVGIDAAASMGAMSGGGPVISVLPVALNSSYVSQNTFLRQSIVEKGGVLVTEYFSQQSPGFGAFRVRNRLITGLSCGVLLIQAARKSGTVMYASHAKDQNRDVYVWPGPAEDPAFAGGWDLIQDGAKAVHCGEDILEEYDLRFRRSHEVVPLFPQEGEPEVLPALADPGTHAKLPSELEQVLQALGEEPVSVAQLGEQLGLASGTLLSRLTELEVRGLCAPCPGGRYRRQDPPAPSAGEAEESQEAPPLTMSGIQAAVLSALGRQPVTVADLEAKTDLSPGEILGALTQLELLGLCQSCPGKRYRKL